MSSSSAFGSKEKTRIQKPVRPVFRGCVFFVACVFNLTPVISALAENKQKEPATKQQLETLEEMEEKEEKGKKGEEIGTFQ
jgi:hypothetical protein